MSFEHVFNTSDTTAFFQGYFFSGFSRCSYIRQMVDVVVVEAQALDKTGQKNRNYNPAFKCFLFPLCPYSGFLFECKISGAGGAELLGFGGRGGMAKHA